MAAESVLNIPVSLLLHQTLNNSCKVRVRLQTLLVGLKLAFIFRVWKFRIIT